MLSLFLDRLAPRPGGSRVDMIRLDHFRGFASFWEVPASEPTAVNGHWSEGPGEKLFKAVEQASAELGKAKGLALVIVKRELLYLGSGVDAQDVTADIIALIDAKEPRK